MLYKNEKKIVFILEFLKMLKNFEHKPYNSRLSSILINNHAY